MIMPKSLLRGKFSLMSLSRVRWWKQCGHPRLLSSTQQDGTFRVCVVGSGPAGFYTAQSLLKNNENVTVDILEKLPVPFGLVRYGVAPDHPEIKNVINQFSTLAQSGKCNFLGNINIGTDVTVTELLDTYSAVVLSYGASSDRKLNIPGENLMGVISAKNFVGWYNGVPEDMNLKPYLDTKTAVIIGQGNVALDMARMLLTPISLLQKTDISKCALDALSRSQVRKVFMVGRRGPQQVSFTIKELREMVNLPETKPVLDPTDYEGLDKLIPGLPRSRRRLMELIYKTANQPSGTDKDQTRSQWGLKFLRSPLEIVSEGDSVSGVRFGINQLQHSSDEITVLPTGGKEFIPCGLVLKSIGYKSLPLDPVVPFDDAKGIIRNRKGRVDDLHGLYCSGWVKRGAVGVILSSLNDSMETAKTILEDVVSGRIQSKPTGQEQLIQLLHNRGVKPVTFQDWLNIDEEEQLRGRTESKPREKIADIEEMLKVAFKGKPDT